MPEDRQLPDWTRSLDTEYATGERVDEERDPEDYLDFSNSDID